MPARILIVDDDPETLLAMSSMVEMRLENAVVDTCESVSAALERISTIDYDVIVSDIKMPGTDGFALMESVLQLRPSTPTLLMTAHGDHDLGVRALNAGAYAFIHKPIDCDFFIAWLRRAIQLRQLTRSVEDQNERLGRMVQERTAELERTNRDLKAALEQQRENEEALRESEERLSLSVQVARLGGWELDLTTLHMTCTAQCKANFGLPPDIDFTYERLFEAIHSDDRHRIRAIIRRAIEQHEDYEEEYRCVWSDGTTHWISARGRVFYTDEKPTRMFSMTFDITERKRAEEEQARLLALEQAAHNEAETLNEVARTLGAELNAQTLIQKVTDAGTALTGAKFGAFFYNAVNEQGETYLLYTLSGAPREAFEKFGIPRNTPLFEPTFRGTGIVRIDDVVQDPCYGQNPPYRGMPQGHLPVRSYLAVPVISRSGGVLGGLFFGHPKPGVFTKRAEHMAVGIAAQAAIAIDNARLYGQAQKEITERKQAEEALRESEQRYRHLVHALPAAIYTCDAQGRVTLYNDAAVALWGRKPELGKDLWCGSWRIYEPAGRPMPLESCPMALAIREGRAVHGREIVIERPDGTRSHVLPYPDPIRDVSGAVVGAVNMLVDITERKRAEHAAAHLAAIVSSSDDAIISKDLQGVIMSWNKGAERLFGYAAEEIIGRSVTLIIPPERLHEEPKILERITRGERIEHYETVRRRKDGSHIDISLTVSPVNDAMGRIIGASKIARDITEHKRAEHALHASEERLRLATEGARMGTWDVTLRTGAAVWNRQHYLIMGYDPESGPATYEMWRSRLHPDDLDQVLAAVERAKQDRSLYDCEHRIVRADTGAIRWIIPFGRFLYDETDVPVRFIGVCFDVTERHKAEEDIRRLLEQSRAHERDLRDKQDQLVQAAKLASLGELASGVAHELNNPLNNINLLIGNVLHLLQEVPIDREQIVRSLRIGKEQVQKAATIISHLRTFARTSRSARERVSVNQVIDSTLMLLRPQLKLLGIDITMDLAAEDKIVLGNSIQLEQVMINLLTNARDAVETTSCKHIALGTAVQDGHVEIRVQDSGVGIPIELQPRIFDPFFTTKVVGRGTGLGLSISYGIIKEHGGEITVNSQPGQGAMFLIRLPLAESSSA